MHSRAARLSAPRTNSTDAVPVPQNVGTSYSQGSYSGARTGAAMSNYEPYPADSAAQQAAQQPAERGPRPQSVQRAVLVMWAKIGLNVLGALVGLLTVGSVVDDAVATARESGTTVPDADTVRTFVVVGIVIALLVGVALMSVLTVFTAKGANWARITYTVLVALGLVSGVLGLVTGSVGGADASPPVLSVVISVLGLLLSVAVLVLLWRKESNAWFAPRVA